MDIITYVTLPKIFRCFIIIIINKFKSDYTKQIHAQERPLV